MTPELYNSCFRPRQQPARAIYDAFQEEANRRRGRTLEEWTTAEAEAVWAAARDQAQMLGLRVPTLQEVQDVELLARGHVDYGSKWASYVERLMRQEQPHV